VGVFNGNLNIGPFVFNSDYRGTYVTKHDAAGNLIWANALDDDARTDSSSFDITGTGISVDCNGNVYITGYFGSDIQQNFTIIHDGVNITTTGVDLFVINVDTTTGYFNWAIQSNSNNDTESYAITTDCNGLIYITGTYQGTTSIGTDIYTSIGWDAFVTQIDPSIPNFIWTFSTEGQAPYNDCYTEGVSITTDCKGNIYFTGDAMGLVYFYGNNTTAVLDNLFCATLFVAKLDPNNNGSVIWMIGELDYCCDSFGTAITCDCEGNIYIAGQFSSDGVTLGSYYLQSYGTDILVAKINENGNWLWARNVGSNNAYCYGIVLDVQRNVYITGRYFAIAMFGGQIPSLSANDNNILTAKLDNNGFWIWAVDAGFNGYNESRGITLDYHGNIYTTGYITPCANFGSIQLCPSSSNNENLFIAKQTDDTQINLIGIAQTSGFAGQYLDPKFDATPSGNVYTDLIPATDYGVNLNGSLVPICPCIKCTYSGIKYIGTSCSSTQLLINNTQTNYIPPNNLGNIDTFQMNFTIPQFDFQTENTIASPYTYSGNNSIDIPIASISHLYGRTIYSFGAVLERTTFNDDGFSISLIDGPDPFTPSDNPIIATVYGGNSQSFEYTIGPFVPMNNVLTIVVNSSNLLIPTSDGGSVWSIFIRYS